MTSDMAKTIIYATVFLLSMLMITQCAQHRDKQLFELKKAELQQYG